MNFKEVSKKLISVDSKDNKVYKKCLRFCEFKPKDNETIYKYVDVRVLKEENDVIRTQPKGVCLTESEFKELLPFFEKAQPTKITSTKREIDFSPVNGDTSYKLTLVKALDFDNKKVTSIHLTHSDLAKIVELTKDSY